MQMPNRGYTASSNYRYGFNGKENDNEVKGTGNDLDYGMRVYDPRVGKFLSVDPLQDKYPELTPYQFASNSPIANVDLDGLEQLYYSVVFDKGGKPALKYDGYQLRGPTYWQSMMGDLLGIDQSEWSGDILPFSLNLSYNGKNNQFQTAKELVGFVNNIPVDPKNAERQEEIETLNEAGDALKWMVIGEMYYQQDIADGHFDGAEYMPNSGSANKKASEVHGRNKEAAKSNAANEPTKPGPTEAYNREKHYGKTPTPADRKALNAQKDEVVDHKRSLVEHYYEGDGKGSKAGYLMTEEERKKFAKDRNNMQTQKRQNQISREQKSQNIRRKKRKNMGYNRSLTDFENIVEHYSEVWKSEPSFHLWHKV